MMKRSWRLRTPLRRSDPSTDVLTCVPEATESSTDRELGLRLGPGDDATTASPRQVSRRESPSRGEGLLMRRFRFNELSFEAPSDWLDLSVVTLTGTDSSRFQPNLVITREDAPAGSLKDYA